MKMKFNSETPTEFIRSKMKKKHTDRIVELISSNWIVVNNHLRIQSSNLRERLQRYDSVTQLD